MSVNVKMTPNRKRDDARWAGSSGSVIVKCVRQKPLPSIAAASGMSRGIDVRPASRITVAKGSVRHVWTRMTDSIARRGSPSHIGGFTGSTRSAAASVQFTTL